MALFLPALVPLLVLRVLAALFRQIAAPPAAPLVLLALFQLVVVPPVALNAHHVRPALLSLELVFLLQISFVQVVQVLRIAALRLPAQAPAIVNARLVATVTILFRQIIVRRALIVRMG